MLTKLLLSRTVMVLCLCVSLAGISGAQTAKDYLDRGAQAFEKNDYDAAIVDFTQAIKLDPTAARAYYGRGLAYGYKGSFELAIADLTVLINSQVTSYDIYCERGFYYYETHQTDLALADLNKAVDLDKTNSEGYYRRGLAYADNDKYDQAIADYSKAIELSPKDSLTYYFRARAYEMRAAGSVLNGAEDTRNYDLAIADYGKTSELNPKDADALNDRADLLTYHKGSYDLAIAEYGKVIAFDPENANAYEGRANAYYRKGSCASAFADFSKLLGMKSELNKYGEDSRDRGWVELCLNNGSAAFQDALRSLELNSDGMDGPDGVIIGYFGLRERGDKPGATAFLETWIGKSNPTYWSTYVMRYLHGDLTADQLLATAKGEEQGRITEAHAYIGMNLELSGDHGSARGYFEWVKTQGQKGSAYYFAMNRLSQLPIPAAGK